MAPPFAPCPAVDLLPAFQRILPQLTEAVVEALMPEYHNQVLRLIPILLNKILADTLVHEIRNKVQRMIPITVMEMVRKLVRLKREDDEVDAGTTDDDVAAEGDSKSSGQPKIPRAKYSDVRVSDEEMLARFNEAKRKQAVMQTKDVTNAGVVVPVSFEPGKDGKYAGTRSEETVDGKSEGE